MTSAEKMKQLVSDLNSKKQELQELAKAEGMNILKESFKAFFEAYPEVKLVQWKQYTPYFNDGDACVFRVNEFEFTTTEYADLDDVPRYLEEDEGSISNYGHYDYLPYDYTNNKPGGIVYHETREGQRAKAMDDLENTFDEKFLLYAFGDHVRIIVTPDAISIIDHDHD